VRIMHKAERRSCSDAPRERELLCVPRLPELNPESSGKKSESSVCSVLIRVSAARNELFCFFSAPLRCGFWLSCCVPIVLTSHKSAASAPSESYSFYLVLKFLLE
jgi:hypothetical protein